jgi:hypothetical protein
MTDGHSPPLQSVDSNLTPVWVKFRCAGNPGARIVANRGRFSRWALAAGVVTAVGMTEYVVFSQTGIDSIVGGARLFETSGVSRGLAELGVVLSCFALGPASLFLSYLASREIRLNPEMRGDRLALLARAFGWLATIAAILILLIVGLGLYIGSKEAPRRPPPPAPVPMLPTATPPQL